VGKGDLMDECATLTESDVLRNIKLLEDGKPCDVPLIKLKKHILFQKHLNKIYSANFGKSEKGKLWRKEYDKSEKRKAFKRAYKKSEKYKAWAKKYKQAYRQTEKYKAQLRVYHQSEKYKAYQKAYKLKKMAI
jgi:hypothetical protein